MPATKPFVLVDGSSYLFRAYYALPPLTNKHGEPTGAMYGVINMLRKLVAEYSPEYMAVVFDPRGKTLRHDLYKEYKANRTVMPDDLQQQIAPLHQMIEALGMPLIVVPGVEADDVIGTLARAAEAQGQSVLISTGDKDLAQLVNANISLVNTMNAQRLTPETVREKFGVPPEKMIDYLSLTGDTSDNIPGVHGVGPKTAVKWLETYGSLDNIIQQAAEIKGKVGDNLRAALNDLPLTKQLVTIVCDIPLEKTWEVCRLAEPNRSSLAELFSRYEFKQWLAELDKTEPKTEAKAEVKAEVKTAAHYQCINTQSEWQKQLEVLKSKHTDTLAFDTETTSIQAMSAQLVGFSFAYRKEEAAYVPLAHKETETPQLDMTSILADLARVLDNPNLKLIGHHLKYDLEILRHYNIIPKAQLWDTMIASYVLNSSGSRHDLASLAKQLLGRDTIAFETVAGSGVKQKTFDHVSIKEATEYAAEDAEVTLALADLFSQQFAESPRLLSVFNELDMPLVPILTRMEYQGVLIDPVKLAAQSEELAQKIQALEEQAFVIAGENFNLASPKQLQTILFEKLGIMPTKKTPSGQASTAEDVLQELARDHELPAIILMHRSLSKLKSTYTDKLPLMMNEKTGRVHTSYNQAVTVTGRLSSNNPNLQNIPIRTEEGRRIRQAFVAPAGYRLISADYSQIELRIIAHVSQDPGLLRAFQEGLDVHRATASEVFGVPLAQVTAEQRRHAKTINFGLLYGMSAFGLSQNLGIDRSSAAHYMDIYFKRYPKVHEYMQESTAFAAAHGYVESIFGRRVPIADIRSKNPARRKAAERAAINAPMQSSAADIIKKAMICVDAYLQKNNLPAAMIMQVHDELILEARADVVDQVVEALRSCMESAVSLSVPITVDIGIGDNWGEAH